MQTLQAAILSSIFVVFLTSCSGDTNEAIAFAEKCYTNETLLQRDTGKIMVEPTPSLSDADKQNGISWRGTATIHYTIFNPAKDAWQDGTSVYHLIRKQGEFEVEHGRECRRNGAPGMVIP